MFTLYMYIISQRQQVSLAWGQKQISALAGGPEHSQMVI